MCQAQVVVDITPISMDKRLGQSELCRYFALEKGSFNAKRKAMVFLIEQFLVLFIDFLKILIFLF